MTSRSARWASIPVVLAAVVMASACSGSGTGGDGSGGPPEGAPVVSERLDGARLWTARDGSVELAVQTVPTAPVLGKPVEAVIEAVDRRGGLSTISILWGDEDLHPQIPGDLIVDCVAGAKTPTEAEPDDRERRRESHVYAEPGGYQVVVVALGAGCGYSNTARIRKRLNVGIEAELLESG